MVKHINGIWFKRIFSFAVILSFLLSFSAVTGSAAPKETGSKSMVAGITVDDGYFLNDFDEAVFHYDVYMASFHYDLSVSLDLTDSRFEYTISGDDTITAGRDSENIVTIYVYDPLGEYEAVIYYLNIYVGLDSIENVTWAGLSYLDVENGIFSPQFSKYRVTYYAILENAIDSFEAAGVNYRTLNPDAIVETKCRDTLNDDGTIPEGMRVEYTIKVTESGGKSKTYYLNLYRKASMTSPVSDTATLANITINGGAVPVKGFSRHKSYYDIKVPQTITNLDIQAYPADRSDIAYVLGPTSMNQDGAVFVNILVSSPSEETYSIYTLRLEYDSFIYTEKFSSFQLTVYLILTGIICLLIGFFAAWYKDRKRKRDIDDTDSASMQKRGESNAETEAVSMV